MYVEEGVILISRILMKKWKQFPNVKGLKKIYNVDCHKNCNIEVAKTAYSIKKIFFFS